MRVLSLLALFLCMLEIFHDKKLILKKKKKEKKKKKNLFHSSFSLSLISSLWLFLGQVTIAELFTRIRGI